MKVHIFSQGKPSDYSEYKDVTLHLDEPLMDTFLMMVMANVLVISGSSFSYAAALLSDGEIHYTRFWHSPLPHWHIICIPETRVYSHPYIFF